MNVDLDLDVEEQRQHEEFGVRESDLGVGHLVHVVLGAVELFESLSKDFVPLLVAGVLADLEGDGLFELLYDVRVAAG